MTVSDALRNRRVFVTGDSGFVGGWLCHALLRHGAKVHGFSIADPAPRSVGHALIAGGAHPSRRGDIRDLATLRASLEAAAPEIIVHLAAQPIVRLAYHDPLGTFAANAMGTANLLEAARGIASLKAIVVFTSDKVYANPETGRPFVESDALGSDEPYAASKAACEMAVATWSSRYFVPRGIGVGCIRAGNIVGGGDWAADRIVPDAIRAFAEGKPLVLRRPKAVRPWQHVLEPVAGILGLAQRLLKDPVSMSRAWNLGPRREDCVDVGSIAERLVRAWGPGAQWQGGGDASIPEAGLLLLDSTAARERLGWTPQWTIDPCIERTVAWYRGVVAGGDPIALADADLAAHRGASP
ncbi:MAG: CDP-glucose 4,6-dehydratase [Alphaproteobacteria bacterium]|nr:CDP-glucose 4,6-dehydratase [Alphaproteobacteria bacterium]